MVWLPDHIWAAKGGGKGKSSGKSTGKPVGLVYKPQFEKTPYGCAASPSKGKGGDSWGKGGDSWGKGKGGGDSWSKGGDPWSMGGGWGKGWGKGKDKGKGKSIKSFPNSVKVWIGDLPAEVTWKELQEHMNQAGKTKWCEVYAHKGKGTACVAYGSEDEASGAVAMLNGSVLGDAAIVCDLWEKKPQA